jgi:Lrp/AsnC family transcriptional regulator, leucine-responsive regulatory protein
MQQDLDRLSLRLLGELAKDGRASHVQLSERIGLSATACARRQRTLEEDGFILGYQALLGLKAFGLATTVIVRITLNSQSEGSLHAFETAIMACPSVVRCFLMSGSDDYLIMVVARDIEDFEHIHKTQLSRLPHVARMQSSFALREVMNRHFPATALSDKKNKKTHSENRRSPENG